jgi:hypothetical protein
MTFKLITCCLVSLLSVCITVGQSQHPSQNQPQKATVSLDPEEEQQVQKLAGEFIKRLRETRDVSPLIDEMFVSDFKKLLTADGWWTGLIELPFPVAKQLDEDERYRLYRAQFSLKYLFKLYYAGKVSSTEGDPKTVLPPPQVVEYVNSSNPPTGEIKTHKDALRLVVILENTLKLMREEMARNPPEESEQFKKNSASFSSHLQEPDNPEGRPIVSVLNREFVRYPVGTRLVKLVIPFHNLLMLVKENGQFKIVFALTNIPPD